MLKAIRRGFGTKFAQAASAQLTETPLVDRFDRIVHRRIHIASGVCQCAAQIDAETVDSNETHARPFGMPPNPFAQSFS
jgi:ATP-dependent protease HslVU (ClpYQ) peptidase subunit